MGEKIVLMGLQAEISEIYIVQCCGRANCGKKKGEGF